MRCPNCSALVTRKEMIAPLGWTSFVCHACKTQLDATKLSQSIVILVATLASVGVDLGLRALGLGSIPGMVGMGVTLLAGAYFGMGAFAHLTVHPKEHPSVLS